MTTNISFPHPDLIKELDISECFIPDDEDDAELMKSPTSGQRSEKGENIANFATPENRKYLEKIFRKLNYNNCEDVLFSSYVKLYSFRNKAWRDRGVAWLKIVRQLEDGPCRGNARIVVYRRGTMATLVEHTLEEEMQVQMYHGRDNAVVWSSAVSITGGDTFAAIFSPANGHALVRDFIASFEKGKNYTALTRLGLIEKGLRVVDKTSLVLSNTDIRPQVQKRRRLSVD